MKDLNKLRQVNPHWKPTKNFIKDQEEAKQKAEEDKYDGDIDPVRKVLAQQIDEEMNPSKYKENDLEQAKRKIIDKILKHFDDTLFEMVCEEMSNNYLFQSSNYLTEAGYDVFEDEWFEFYHEHHGDILFQVKTEINM